MRNDHALNVSRWWVVAFGLAYAGSLAWLWHARDGVLLTSADDATRLLMAHQWGSQGIFPSHWTWPPLPMVVDGLVVALGGDVVGGAAIVRAMLMGATGLLLARFWARCFPQSWRPSVFLLSTALWLSFPLNVRLALSGLSEPYLYFLLAVGLTCWQQALEVPTGNRLNHGASRTTWLVVAGLSFGLSVWCRYEGTIMAALLALWIVHCAIRIRHSPTNLIHDPVSESLLWPFLATALLPVAWLALQFVEHGDPLHFVWATRAVVHEEAARAYGSSRMPVHAVLRVLVRELWSVPVALLALVGILRLRRENPRAWRAVFAFVFLYVAMATVSIGGRFGYYLNLFSLIVIPLAAQGAAIVSGVAALRMARWIRTPVPFVARFAMAAIGFYVIAAIDLPSTLRGTRASWLSPQARELFIRLRHHRASDGRVLVAFLPKQGIEHVYDPFAVQLADPERVVVLPFAYPLVTDLDAMPRWVVYPPWNQVGLRENSAALEAWLREQQFSQVFWEEPEATGSLLPTLERLGYYASQAKEPGDGTRFVKWSLAGSSIAGAQGR